MDDFLTRLVEERDTLENDLKPAWELHDLMWSRWQITPEQGDPASPYLSKVKVPYGFHAVETILPRIVGEDPSMKYRAVEDNDDTPVAHIQGGLASWEMERMDFRLHSRRFIRQGLVTGYTIAKVGWAIERERRPKMREAQVYHPEFDRTFTIEQPDSELVTLRNAPWVETVSTYDFLYPLYANDLDDAEVVWQRSWMTLAELRATARTSEGWKNLKDVRGEDDARRRNSRMGQFDQQNLTPSNPRVDVEDDDAVVEVWERWTDDRLVVLASPTSNPVIVRDIRNPFDHKRKPFIDWSPIPRNFQLHGMGVIQVLYDLNEDLNTMRRQRRDALTYILNPAWTGPDGAVEGNQLTLFPGVYIPQDEIGGEVRALLSPPTDFASSHQEEERIISDMQNLSGAFNYLSGADAGANASQTATGVATITNEGNKRIGEMVTEFDLRAMRRFGRLLASMNTQYIESSVAVSFSDDPAAAQAWLDYHKSQMPLDEAMKKLITVTPEQIQAKGLLEPIPQVGKDKQLNEVQKRSDATQLVQALAPFLALPIPVVNLREVIGHVLESFGVDKFTRERMLTPPQQPQMPQQQMPQLPPGDSGPSGENAPTGNVVGTPGAAGA